MLSSRLRDIGYQTSVTRHGLSGIAYQRLALIAMINNLSGDALISRACRLRGSTPILAHTLHRFRDAR